MIPIIKDYAHNGWIWIAIGLLLLVIVYFIPVDVVYTVPVQGKIYPVKEWKLISSDGTFHTEQHNFGRAETAAKRTFVFERGDVVDIDYASGIQDRMMVSEGTPLLTFNSMQHRLDVQRAENEMEIQQSLYRADATPDRSPAIDLAKEELLLAEADLDLQTKNTERFAALLEADAISQFEYDIQETTLKMARQQVALSRQRLKATTFGEKSEDLDVFSTMVSTAENELEVLRSRQASYEVKAPFDGLLKLDPITGVVAQVLDTTKQVLVFPIALEETEYINHGGQLHMSGCDGVHPFELTGDIAQVKGAQVRMGSVLLDHHAPDIGGFSSHEIHCDTVRLGIYLRRRLF